MTYIFSHLQYYHYRCSKHSTIYLHVTITYLKLYMVSLMNRSITIRSYQTRRTLVTDNFIQDYYRTVDLFNVFPVKRILSIYC